jgi:hypothetical protein
MVSKKNAEGSWFQKTPGRKSALKIKAALVIKLVQILWLWLWNRYRTYHDKVFLEVTICNCTLNDLVFKIQTDNHKTTIQIS